MNETSGTQTDPGPAGDQPADHRGGPNGPRVSRDQMRDLDRLRRSSTDRYIAGVAGGLGRHFDIDPTVIRVALVVLSFFGGAGLLLYGAAWLFLPDDQSNHAPIDTRTDVRRALLLGAAVLAGLVFVGTTFSDQGWSWGFPIPILVLAVIAIVVFANRDRRRNTPPPAPWGNATSPGGAPPSTTTPEGTAMSVTDAPSGATDPATGAGTTPAYGQAPPAWMPPQPQAYVPPPKPRRTGLVLFWPTVALIAIAMGTLGIIDTTVSFPIATYAAVALAITGVMLLVGAFVGRPGGLIALGLAGSVALAITGAADAATGGEVDNRELVATPLIAATVADDYSVSTGEIVVDLTRVRDLQALDGREIDVHLNAGEITVWVPPGLDVDVDARMRYAGEIRVGEVSRGGFDLTLERTLSRGIPNAPRITLDVDARVGQITVDHN
ncbi:MAG TPA: PspC domain-containing protein [Marmoricola sp.]|nr:PspC domain-containing protein [Marmoricola sp.]